MDENSPEIIALINILSTEKCPCGKVVPRMLIFDIRGERRCLHCQLDRMWDHIDEDRRTIKVLMERSLSIDWDRTQKE